jgi:predicted ribosome quality control (RQC) complex YloA/Tae2 family protein
MHLNYYFFQRLVPVLTKRIVGNRLLRTFSQDKDELILEFGEGDRVGCTVRAILKSDFTTLYFPERFERARANSVDLFKGLAGVVVQDVLLYENERAFSLVFVSGEKLVFKMFGNRSNLLHFSSEGKLISLFNHRLAADRALDERALDRPIDQTFEQFVTLGGDYGKLFPTFGKWINQYIQKALIAATSLESQWDVIQDVLGELKNGKFYLVENKGGLVFSLVPFAEVKEEFEDPIVALNAFCLSHFRVGNLQREKDQAIKQLAKRIGQTESYLVSAYEKLDKISETGKNEQFGNLLMANLHVIGARQEVVELENFYTGETVSIKLKPELSPVKNAEIYFRKAKNEKQEVEQTQQNIEAREAGLAQLNEWVAAIEEQSTVKELRAFLKTSGVFAQAGDQSARDIRFRKEEFLGYEIFVGKSAKNNDELTLKFAGKEDIWLHAKDVSGSHVIIRTLPGKKVPSLVIERAAELAAWHSKRRNDSLCPVSYTPRKYVRKSKGMPAGALTVEKESVVMVVPKA